MTITRIAPRDTAVDACAEAIRRAILTGEYKAGQRLPPERKLAELFGVNRVTVRSALTRLATARLLSVRQGSGYVVRDFRRNAGPDLIPELIGVTEGSDQILLLARDVLVARRYLALALVERIIEIASKGPIDTTELRARLADYEKTVNEGADFRRIADADLACIRAFVAIGQSPTLQLTMNPLIGIFAGFPIIQRVVYRSPKRNIDSYHMMIEALKTPSTNMLTTLDQMLRAVDEQTIAALKEELDKAGA